MNQILHPITARVTEEQYNTSPTICYHVGEATVFTKTTWGTPLLSELMMGAIVFLFTYSAGGIPVPEPPLLLLFMQGSISSTTWA